MSTSKKQNLRVKWEEQWSYFDVPVGIDLRDTKNVCWYVKWGMLCIETKDGRKMEIPCDGCEMKWWEKLYLEDENEDEESVRPNTEFEDSSSEDEESESEEEKEKCDRCERELSEDEELYEMDECISVCEDCAGYYEK